MAVNREVYRLLAVILATGNGARPAASAAVPAGL
jgi:hypothetical protein